MDGNAGMRSIEIYVSSVDGLDGQGINGSSNAK